MKPDQNIPTSTYGVLIRLLLVEDNPGDARLVQEMLRDQSHIRLEVTDCLASCMTRLNQGGIDIVLLDLGLRDSQGLDTLTSVAQAHSALPIVALTGLDDDVLALRTVQAGGQDYLTKSTVTPEILRRTIRHAIERKQVESQKNAALEALQRSEENFRLSLEDSPLGVRIATAKGETIYANKVFLDLYGYANIAELNKIPLKERYTPQSYAESRIRKKNRDQGDFGPSVYEINIVRENGEIRHLQVLRKEIIWNGTKQFQVIYQDITERKRAESEREAAIEALRETRDYLDSLIDYANAPIITWDTDHRITKFNHAFEKITGYHADEVIGQGLSLLFPSESIGEALQKIARTSTGELWDSVEIPIKRKNGEVRTALWNSANVYAKDGKTIMATIAQGQDITERKRAEAQREAALDALQVNEKKLKEAQALGQIGNWEYDIKTQKITWSKQVYTLYERDPVLGPPTAEEEALYYSPEQAQTLRGYTRNAIETGQFFEYDLQATLPSGKQVYLTARMRPIKDEQDRVIKLFGVVQDITERKRTETQREVALEALRESEKKYHSVFNNFIDLYYQTDMQGLITNLSPSCFVLSGWKPEELIGYQVLELYTDQKQRKALLEKLLQEGVVSDYEITLLHRDGRHISVSVSSHLIRDEQGNPKYVEGIIRDITERKRAEELIRTSLAEKEVLLKEIHHRVKNNLTTIIGLIKMQEVKANNKMFNPLLRELEGRIRAMALVHESLHKSKDLAHVDLQNYIETMGAQIRDQFGADRDIRFSVQAAGVDVDLNIAVPCGLILNELITNAYKHAFPAGQPGEICVSFQERTGTVPGRGTARRAPTDGENAPTFELTVADNGVGLPAGLDWEKSETLGLRLIKMLSQQINGSLGLDRSAGTAFRLSFAYPTRGN